MTAQPGYQSMQLVLLLTGVKYRLGVSALPSTSSVYVWCKVVYCVMAACAVVSTVCSYGWLHGMTPSASACAGFIAGERADVVSRMDPQQAIQAFLQQLNTMFGTQQHPHPATSAYVTAHVFDWSKQEWVGAAYSYPTLGAEPTDRDALAAPVLSSIFFAGEATHPAVNPCMQAALDTGRRAAYQVKAALQQPTSKL